MPDKTVWAQRDFSAGQIDETALRGDDSQIMRAGVRVGRNVRILNTRALKRRPGRRLLFEHNGIVEVIRPAVGELWYMVLEAGSATFRSSDLSARFTFTGMAWSRDQITSLRYDVGGGNVIVTGVGRPQVFSYSPSARSWISAPFAFALDQNGAVRQPYHQFYTGQGITLRANSRSGLIDVHFSAPILAPGHVGVVFRYVKRQLRITSVTSPTHGTAEVIEQLPPTYRVTVDNMAGLQLGDSIKGVTSGAEGRVVAFATLAT